MSLSLRPTDLVKKNKIENLMFPAANMEGRGKIVDEMYFQWCTEAHVTQ